MSQYRESTIGEGADIDADPWASENNMLDIKIQLVHFVFWLIVLIMIEKDCFRCKRCCISEVPIDTFLVLDEDVQDEVARMQ